jgi:hypothetical protein
MVLSNYRFKLFPKNQNWKVTSENKGEFVGTKVPGNIRPADDANSKTAFKAKPLKIFRRGYVGNKVSGSKTTLFESMEKPGTNIVNYGTTPSGEDSNVGFVKTTSKISKSDNPHEVDGLCINHEHIARTKTHHPTLLETKKDDNGRKIKYHTRLEDLRKYRNQTFNDSQTTSDNMNCNGNKCNIIKHSNPNYSVQGAVDAGTRLENLKYQTINKAANSLKGNFGNNTANNSSYNGKYNAPYTLKSKTNTPVCFIRGGRTKYLGKSYC